MIYVRLACVALLFLGTGCANRSRIAQLYPDVAEHAGKEIKSVRFVGGEPFAADSLQVMIETKPTRCTFLGFPICIPIFGIGREVNHVDPNAVVRDAGRLTVFYRREGYFGTRVTPRIEPREAGGEDVEVSFVIRRGDAVILDTLHLEGIAGVLDSAALARSLPLQPGDMFDLDEYGLSADQVLRELQNNGHAYASVLRNYDADTLTDRATATITAVPGPVVRVDSIIVTGANELGRRTAIRQLGFRKGDVLHLPTLADAQRNLYNLELVQIASVALAPDSLQMSTADSTTATVLVAIAESDEHQAEATVGFGTVECVRIDGNWRDRSFTGGGRRLSIDGSVSKLGVAGRSKSLGGNICSGADADPITIDTIPGQLNYRIAAEFTQPYFLSPRNQLVSNIYAERESQTDFSREAVGGRVAVTHRLAPRTTAIGSVDIENGSTIAEPVLFCTAFLICTPEDFTRVTGKRFRNTLGLNFIQDHTDHPLDPTRGHIVRTGVAWAAPFLSSDVTFVRWTGEASAARIVKPSWVLAGSIRLGNFFQSASLNPERNEDDFLPPEERFYAGGANSVRGFERNRLGPVVYFARRSIRDSLGVVQPAEIDSIIDLPEGARDTVYKVCSDCVDVVPTGGTSVAVVNAELRFPSPFFRRQLRLAAFIDAGSVSSGNLWDARDWRITPGVGLRIITPVGPARVDMAYNPYDSEAGALYVLDDNRQIIRTRTDFQLPSQSFWAKLKFHVAIGQAF
jgi:outer membrane protein assembly factor BamA